MEADPSYDYATGPHQYASVWNIRTMKGGGHVKLEKINGLPCGSDGCPTVYRTDRNTVVICGRPIDQETHAAAKLTHGEVAVEIPVEILTAAAEALAPP